MIAVSYVFLLAHESSNLHVRLEIIMYNTLIYIYCVYANLMQHFFFL